MIKKTVVMSLAGAALMLGGCASVEDVHHAQSTADEALAAAHHAQQSADSAMSAAQSAQQGVDQLKADQASETRHRGPKG